MATRREVLLGSTALIAATALPSFAFAADPTFVWSEAETDDATYDPRVTQNRHEQQVIAQVFDQLLYSDNAGKLTPYLATAWTIADDRQSVMLTLRTDVKFHDGTPLDAAAVKFTFDSIIDPATASQSAIDIVGPYVGSDVLAPNQIRLRYSRPFAGIADSLADVRASIVSPTAVAKLGNMGFAQSPVGSGPYKFTGWTHSQQVTLERNPDYVWGPAALATGPAKIAHVVHRFVPTDSTRVAALESGEVQVCESAPILDTKRLADGTKFKSLTGIPAGMPFGFLLNTTRGPFMDIRVRQAFIMSVDRKAIANSLFFGIVNPASGPITPSTRDYWSGVEKINQFDRAAAGKLLDDAGWKMGSNGIRQKDGQPLAIYLPTLLEPDTAVAVQADAKKSGFDVTVENVLKAKQDELIYSNTYDTLSLRFSGNDASVLEVPFTTKNIPAPGKFSFNWARYSNPELDMLLQQAAGEGDPAKRAQDYADAQKIIANAAIFLPIHDPIEIIVYSAKATGLVFARGNFQVRLVGVNIAA